MALLSVIRRWHLRDGMAIREIARRTGLSRNTIRKYLSSGIVEPKYPERQSPSKLDAFAPGSDPSGSWYDEMLIDGDTVVVIGYSYSRGGTEIGLFDIGADGKLAYRATYHLRSNDYYSSRNYASRLVGSKLVFYSPLSLNLRRGDPFGSFPALRRWRHLCRQHLKYFG